MAISVLGVVFLAVEAQPSTAAVTRDQIRGTSSGEVIAKHTIKAVVVKSFDRCYGDYADWDWLNANWSSLGSQPIQIVYDDDPLCYTITYPALVASHADVVIVSDSLGYWDKFSPKEIAALRRYTNEGHGLIGTYQAFADGAGSIQNRGLAPVFGIRQTHFSDIGHSPKYWKLQRLNMLLAALPNPFQGNGLSYASLAPPDGQWNRSDLDQAHYAARTVDKHSAIIKWRRRHPRSVRIYISTIPEYSNWEAWLPSREDRQLVYNAIVLAGK